MSREIRYGRVIDADMTLGELVDAISTKFNKYEKRLNDAQMYIEGMLDMGMSYDDIDDHWKHKERFYEEKCDDLAELRSQILKFAESLL